MPTTESVVKHHIGRVAAVRGRSVTWRQAHEILGLSESTIRRELVRSLNKAYPHARPMERAAKLHPPGHTFELAGYTVTISRRTPEAHRQIRIVLEDPARAGAAPLGR